MEASRQRRLFTVEEYVRMAEVGILTRSDRVELIRGEIVQMSPIGPDHQSSAMRLNQLFTLRLGRRALVSVQGPLKVEPRSLPEPDIVILAPRQDFYRSRYGEPGDTWLLIEIANTSLAWDRRVKGKLYAECRVVEYWIINLRHGCVEVFQDPTPEGYGHSAKHHPPDVLRPVAFPDVEIPVLDLLGEPT